MTLQLSPSNKKLADILLEHRLLDTNQLGLILEQHSLIGGRLADFLMDAAIVPEARLLLLFERLYGYPIAGFSMLEHIDYTVSHVISANLAQLQMVIPFSIQGQEIHLAFLEPPDLEDVVQMKGLAAYTPKIYLAPRDMIQWALATHYPELYLDTPKTPHDPLENRIGHRLIAEGLLTKQQLEEALLERTPGKAGRTGELLLRMGYIAEDDFYRSLAAQTKIPFVKIPHEYQIPKTVAALFTRADAARWHSLPVFEDSFSITIITSEPSILAELQPIFERSITLMLSTPSQIKMLTQQLESQDEPLTRLLWQQGKLRLEQRAKAGLYAKENSLEIGAALLILGYISQKSLQETLAALPDEQVIPTEQPWEMSFFGGTRLEEAIKPKPESPELLESKTATLSQPLEAAIRALIRQELEQFKKQLR